MGSLQSDVHAIQGALAQGRISELKHQTALLKACACSREYAVRVGTAAEASAAGLK